MVLQKRTVPVSEFHHPQHHNNGNTKRAAIEGCSHEQATRGFIAQEVVVTQC
jgi:hypothetical protein